MSTVIPYGFIKPRQLCVGRYAMYCAEANRPIHRYARRWLYINSGARGPRAVR